MGWDDVSVMSRHFFSAIIALSSSSSSHHSFLPLSGLLEGRELLGGTLSVIAAKLLIVRFKKREGFARRRLELS